MNDKLANFKRFIGFLGVAFLISAGSTDAKVKSAPKSQRTSVNLQLSTSASASVAWPFFYGQIVEDPASTYPGTDSTIMFIMENVGNTTLNYTLVVIDDDPPGNVEIRGGDGVIPSTALNADTIEVVLNAQLSTVVQNMTAKLVLSGNFLGSPDTGWIDYCNCDLQWRRVDTLDNSLVFDNRGSIGNQNNNGKNDYHLNFPQSDFAAELDTNSRGYLFDGSPVISVDGIVATAMFDNDFVDSTSFRPLEDPTTSSDATWWYSHSGNFTLQDSTLGSFVELWQKLSPEVNTANSAFRVTYARTGLFNRTGGTIQDVTYAWGWDWDVPSDSGARNLSGVVNSGAGSPFIWMHGSEFGADTGNASVIPADRRWAAVRWMGDRADMYANYAGSGGGKRRANFVSHITRDNVTFVGGDWDHKRLDSLLQNIVGFDTYTSSAPDSMLGVDLNMIMNAGKYDVGVGDTLYFYWIAVTGISESNALTELQAIVSAAANGQLPPDWESPTCCDLAGDADNNGKVNVGDVTYLISRIFAGGPPPACCAEGSANGDSGVAIGDVTYLIARIFSNGPAPICGPAGMVCSPE